MLSGTVYMYSIQIWVTNMAKYRRIQFSDSFLNGIFTSKIEEIQFLIHRKTVFGLKIHFSNLKITVSSIRMLASLQFGFKA
jgi:gamma-glutamyl:cysteine ligase YbdK (ATP-grasp superfamily)